MEDQQVVLIEWNPQQMDIVKTALSRYQQILQQKHNTPPIEQEREIIRKLRFKLKQAIQQCADAGDTATPGFNIEDYLFLCDLLHKYWGARRQEYKERVNFVTVKGELFYEERELEQIKSIMLTHVFMELDKTNQRRKLLTDSLYVMPEEKKPKEQASQSITNIHQNIENNYGQAVASNQGIVNQTNNPEITDTLMSLIAKVLESDILGEEKSEIVADLEIMKEESTKKKPDKKLFKLKMPTIERLSAYAQVASFVHQILPTIQHFADLL